MGPDQFMLERARQLRTSSTPGERRVWSILRARRLAGLKFRRQHVLGNYIADFVCLPARLVIEVDGDTHGDDEARLRDARRTEDLERSGYRVIRFSEEYVVIDTDGGVYDAIVEALMASALPVNVKARLTRDFFLAPLPDPLP